MDLKDFIAIRGKSELFRIISRSPKGIIVETLNESRAKFKVQPNLQVLILFDITIFSKDNSDLYLKDVFLKIYEKDGLKPSVDQKDDPAIMKKYFTGLVPNHDEEKVYVSDIKKMIKWYNIIASWYPDVLEDLKTEAEKPAETEEEKEKPEETEPGEKNEAGETVIKEEITEKSMEAKTKSKPKKNKPLDKEKTEDQPE